jgi:hypothetical protein
MLGAQGLWAVRNLYRAKPAVTRGLRFSGLILQTAPFLPITTHKGMWRMYSYPDPNGSPSSSLLRHTRGCGRPILTRILTGWKLLDIGEYENESGERCGPWASCFRCTVYQVFFASCFFRESEPKTVY